MVPEDLAHFAGHFPGMPILPGVVQVDWSVRLSRTRLPMHGRFSGARNLKFSAIVRPAARLTLTLEVSIDGTRLSFLYSRNSQKCSSGVLVFGA